MTNCKSRSVKHDAIKQCLLGVFVVAASWTAQARAEDPYVVHMVGRSETLASIARLYYGNPQLERVLVAENGLLDRGGASIVPGMRLLIPLVRFHRVLEGESWASLATHYYGSSKRAFVLIEANGSDQRGSPDIGSEILVPYAIRHVTLPSETLSHLAETYLGDRNAVSQIKRFNSITKPRLKRGQIVLIPHVGLTLSEEGRRFVEQRTGQRFAGGDTRAFQVAVTSKLQALNEHVRAGRYVDAIALGNRLLGPEKLSHQQTLEVYKTLAVAYTALDQSELAVNVYRAARELDPQLRLDPRTTSPRLLDVWKKATGDAPKASKK